MAHSPSPSRTKAAKVKRGVMEYLLLALLLLVVIVTGWTLLDNGIADTVALMIGGAP